MYFFKFIFFYLVSIIMGDLVPQLTKSTVEVAKILNENGKIVTNTQFDIIPNGRIAVIMILVMSWIFFLFKYENSKDREEITVKIFFLVQLYICFSGFLYGMNKEKYDVFLIFEFLFGVLFSFLSRGYLEKENDEKEKDKKEFHLYSSRDISKKKLEYLLSNKNEVISSILIDGDWGTGKTYFLDCVLSDKKEKYDIFKYDALLFDSREKLIKVFLNDLKMLLKKYKFLIGDSSDYLSILEPVVSKLPFGLGEIFSKKMSLENSKKEFKEFLERLEKEVIVVIDNFERIRDRKAFIQMIGFLHELNEFGKIKVIAILDRKKLNKIGIEEDYVDKFFINKIVLSSIDIEDILYEEDIRAQIDSEIDIDFIVEKLQSIKNTIKEKKLNQDLTTFENPRVYEQAIKRFNLNNQNYKNLYVSQVSSKEYKEYMLVSSIIYCCNLNLEREEIDGCVTSLSPYLKELFRRDYYDDGRNLGDIAQKMFESEKLIGSFEKNIECFIYYHKNILDENIGKSKVIKKYRDLINTLYKKIDLKNLLIRVDRYSKIYDLLYEILFFEKNIGLEIENQVNIISIVNLFDKKLELDEIFIDKLLEKLIVIYKSEIEEIQFYLNPLGKILTLNSEDHNKEIAGVKEFEKILNIYFLNIKQPEDHLEDNLNQISNLLLKQSITQFIYKYRAIKGSRWIKNGNTFTKRVIWNIERDNKK